MKIVPAKPKPPAQLKALDKLKTCEITDRKADTQIGKSTLLRQPPNPNPEENNTNRMIEEPLTGNRLLKESTLTEQDIVKESQDQVLKENLPEPDRSLAGDEKVHSPKPADKEAKPSRRDSTTRDRSRDKKSNRNS